jgi:hypothetical protein
MNFAVVAMLSTRDLIAVIASHSSGSVDSIP